MSDMAANDSPADDQDELLAEAASVAATLAARGTEAGDTEAADTEAGDLLRFFRAYYGHVPAEDLAAAGPDRLARVALEQARLAAHRPQGRSLVRVLPAPEGATFDPGRASVDIMTDDMPFLIDSITMELARHNLDSYHVIHPQLVVRRDVTGHLREVSGALNGGRSGADELVESWTHIEVNLRACSAPVDVLEIDLHRVLDNVRVAVEDYPRMQAKATWLADRLSAEGAGAADRDGGAAALAGRQPLHVPGLPGVRPGGEHGRDGAAGRDRDRARHPAA